MIPRRITRRVFRDVTEPGTLASQQGPSPRNRPRMKGPMRTEANVSRREFLQGVAAVAAAGSLGCASSTSGGSRTKEVMTMTSTGAAPHVLPKLPWADNALEPYISARTIGFHYGKHHSAYVSKLNAALAGSDDADESLEALIASGDPRYFNNAAQVWNHTFYWHSMRPGGGGAPTGRIGDRISASFGGYGAFKEQFAAAANGQFGSGWAWLVEKDGKLEITATANADTPIAHGGKPLITCDVWEHAYYLDFQNARPSYTAAFLDHLLNWEFAEQNLG